MKTRLLMSTQIKHQLAQEQRGGHIRYQHKQQRHWHAGQHAQATVASTGRNPYFFVASPDIPI